VTLIQQNAMTSNMIHAAAIGLTAFWIGFEIDCGGYTNTTFPSPGSGASAAYRQAAVTAMLAEANEYARRLGLSETLPITEPALKEIFVAEPQLADRFGALGSLRTTNFSYAFGKGKRLSYVTSLQSEVPMLRPERHDPPRIEPPEVNTNYAYRVATQLLARAYVDVPRLLQCSDVSINTWKTPDRAACKCTVEWELSNGKPVAEVTLVMPDARLGRLRIENPELILRPPLRVTMPARGPENKNEAPPSTAN
jgi:hypothetical protein